MTSRRRGLNAPKVLLAEGKDEQFLLPELFELAGVPWAEPAPVEIVETDGVTKLLDPNYVQAAFQAPNRLALGLVVDANGDVAARWQQVLSVLQSVDADYPATLPRNGSIHQPPGRPRLGVWLMPDNERAGMLETLLLAARKDEPAVWQHVDASIAEAKRLGAGFREPHRDKAALHTWLAWQDPPGLALGNAAKAHHFDVRSPAFEPFVAWFRRLFDV